MQKNLEKFFLHIFCHYSVIILDFLYFQFTFLIYNFDNPLSIKFVRDNYMRLSREDMLVALSQHNRSHVRMAECNDCINDFTLLNANIGGSRGWQLSGVAARLWRSRLRSGFQFIVTGGLSDMYNTRQIVLSLKRHSKFECVYPQRVNTHNIDSSNHVSTDCVYKILTFLSVANFSIKRSSSN